MTNKIFIGIVGPIGAGKGTISMYLVNRYGFASFSLSSVVHKELIEKGITAFDRKTLQDIGDSLRRQFGSDVLAKRGIETINHNGIKKVLIDGIRNPAEVKYLKTLPHFLLISVTASPKVRFTRIKKRNKPWDPKTWSDFSAINKRDLGTREIVSGQHVGACMEMADIRLSNNKDIAFLYKKIDQAIRKLIKEEPVYKEAFK